MGVDKAAIRVDVDDALAHRKIQTGLHKLVSTLDPARRRTIIFACIGTDRSTGDSLGPLVGTLLRQHGLPPEQVIGTLQQPLHAANLVDILGYRGLLDPVRPESSPLVLAVDACLGSPSNVGTISLGLGPVRPGAGVNKTLPPVGDIYITGTVNTGGFMEFIVLQNTRLFLVMRMANTIARGLFTLGSRHNAR